MPDPAIENALLRALRVHEIGGRTPYELSFAGKAKSGGSFGFMQGDLAAGQAIVTHTFHDVLEASGFSAGEIGSFTARLSVHLLTSPLTHAEQARIDAALDQHRDMVDRMDRSIAEDVFQDLDLCIGTATSANCRIEPRAQLYIAMWINMTGKPTKLLTWLKGGDPQLVAPVPPAAPSVGVAAIETYLQATDYYTKNPGNFPHMRESANAGAQLLP